MLLSLLYTPFQELGFPKAFLDWLQLGVAVGGLIILYNCYRSPLRKNKLVIIYAALMFFSAYLRRRHRQCSLQPANGFATSLASAAKKKGSILLLLDWLWLLDDAPSFAHAYMFSAPATLRVYRGTIFLEWSLLTSWVDNECHVFV